MEILVLIIKAFVFGMGSSIPIGAAASVILHEAYKDKFQSAKRLILLPITVDVIAMLMVFANFKYLKPFLLLHRQGIQITAGIILCLFAVDLFFCKQKVSQDDLVEDTQTRRMLNRVWLNLITTAVALILLLPSLGGFELFESVFMRICFLGMFVVGALSTWRFTLKHIEKNKDWIREKVPPEKVRPSLGILVLGGAVALMYQGFHC